MDRYRKYVRAAFMVIAMFLLASCTHASTVRSTHAPVHSGVGQQADVPPLADLPDQAPEASERTGFVPPAVTVPEGWVRLPDDQLKSGDSLVLINPELKVALIGRYFGEQTPPGIAIAEVAAAAIEKGYEVDSPYLSDDGTAASVSMRISDQEVVLAVKMVECGEFHSFYLSARGSTKYRITLAAAMSTVLTTLSVPDK